MPAARPTSRSALWCTMSALRKTHMFAANIYFSSFSQRSTREKQRSFPVCFVNIHTKRRTIKQNYIEQNLFIPKEKGAFRCFKFIMLDACCEFVLWFIFWGRDYYAIGVLSRSSSSSVILLSSSGEVRGNVPVLCLTTKLLWLGRFFGSVSTRFFVGFRQRKDRFLSCYTRKSIRQLFLTADKMASDVCAKLLLQPSWRLHIVRTNGIYPCEAAAFCPHTDVFLTAVLLTVDIFLKIEYHICDDMPSAVSDDMRQNALCGQDASEAEREGTVCGLRTVCRLRAFRTQGVLAQVFCVWRRTRSFRTQIYPVTVTCGGKENI